MASLSAIILTHNEAHNIEDCIKSCLFADEILVIDDCSTDNTVSLARAVSSKVKVIAHSLNSDWSQQRNFAMSMASGDFVLFIDADERVSARLQDAILKIVNHNTRGVFAFKRVNNFVSGQPRHGIFRPDWVSRLFPKNAAKYENPVHEKLTSPLETIKIQGNLIHHTYYDWASYWKKFDAYTRIAAEHYFHSGKKVNFFKDIFLRPLWSFLKIYFINLGFLDGRLGWIFSSYHYFYTMTKYVRFYTLKKHNGKI